jgi:hypothetical protein
MTALKAASPNVLYIIFLTHQPIDVFKWKVRNRNDYPAQFFICFIGEPRVLNSVNNLEEVPVQTSTDTCTVTLL